MVSESTKQIAKKPRGTTTILEGAETAWLTQSTNSRGKKNKVDERHRSKPRFIGELNLGKKRGLDLEQGDGNGMYFFMGNYLRQHQLKGGEVGMGETWVLHLSANGCETVNELVNRLR